MKLRTFLSEYRWPLYLTGLLTMSIAAYAILVWVATRPSAPRPIAGFYEASQEWDADEAVVAASRALGWTVTYELPAGVPHVAGAPRPVDVLVADRDGEGVTGLTGRLFALRAAEARRGPPGTLVELPHRPGSYRALLRVDEPGAWDFRLDALRDGQRFVHSARVAVASDAPAEGGSAR
ncbi:MAG: FixH family protein [Thermoanaerobaculia bacterium]|nr:FixH family protein [Thermoanaerobaculia bacterium]